MSYTVKFISHEDFDNLPYNKVSTSIGVADRNQGVAYVRDTGNPMDIFTAYHELEHLKGDDLHEHESPGEDGIYYKNFGETVSQFFQSSIPGTKAFKQNALPVISSLVPGLSAVTSRGNQQQQPQQAPMDSFNPGSIAAVPQGAPATSAIGGGGDGGMGGGLGQGTMDKVRQTLQRQNQSGYYSGRDAGGF